MYCEELDYCLRLRAVGVNSYLVPRSQLWHVGGSARGRQGVDDCLAYYRSRNEIALAKKHGGRWVALMIAIGTACAL
jgi:GT2 family glycosyltransferase